MEMKILLEIHKLNSHVDIFYPSDSGLTNFNWVRLNMKVNYY